MNINPVDWKDWVWPVPVWFGRVPTISDGFDSDGPEDDEHRQHLGVDVTFRKLPTDPQGIILPDMSAHFISPQGTPILAAGPGKIWKTAHTGYGLSVQIDHGKVGSAGGVNSFYQHLDSFSRDWKKGDIVHPGDVLGTMGYDPSGYKFRHLHFELWFPIRRYVRNPAPYMRYWRKISVARGVA